MEASRHIEQTNGLSFNAADALPGLQEQSLEITDFFHLLINVEEYPQILPFAYDFAVDELHRTSSAGEGIFEALDPSKWSENQLASFIGDKAFKVEDAVWKVDDRDKRSRLLKHYGRQFLPTSLLSGCWLQGGSRVAIAHTDIGATFMRLYSQLIGYRDSEAPFEKDIGLSAALERAGVAAGELSSPTFCQDGEIDSASLSLPLFLLSISQFPRSFSAEIAGVHLAWHHLGIPLFTKELLQGLDPTTGELSSNAVSESVDIINAGKSSASDAIATVIEAAETEQLTDVQQRIVRGAAALVRCWSYWLKSTRDSAPFQPMDPTQSMIDLMWKKSAHAVGYHGNRKLDREKIDTLLDPSNFDATRLLGELAKSKWIRPGDGANSRILNSLIGFGGPMTGVFSPQEQETIKNWILDVPTAEKKRDKYVEDLRKSGMSPSAQSSHQVQGRMWEAKEFPNQSHQKFRGISLRQLYYHLVNVEFYPEILPIAEKYARDQLERSLLSINSGERPIPSQKYDPEALRRWVSDKHRQQVDAYRPPASRPEVSREAFIEANLQLAPIILIDGGWLQGISSPTTINTDIGRMLFHVFIEEVGEGDHSQHHANIYRDLLSAMAMSAPSVSSQEFANWSSLDDQSFVVPTLWLALSCFPRHFLPEILGLNLAVELAGIGAPYMEARDTLRKFRYPTLFVDVHNAADNVTSGHSAWAVDTIILYMDKIREREGPHNLDKHWHRVWSGMRATMPQMGDVKLASYRFGQRLRGQGAKQVPLIFPT